MPRENLAPVTPRGFRDVLSDEAEERRILVAEALAAVGAWGYRCVETPVLERAETLTAGAGASLVEGETFRLLDLDGGLLALRPEMTVPIARLVASRLREESAPIRLSYVADVFREHASYRGQYRQFTQVGCEFVGVAGPAADAEVIAAAVAALEAMGLPAFTVAIGSTSVLESMLAATPTKDVWREAMMEALRARNLVELDTLVSGVDLSPSARVALARVPRIRGGREAIEECASLVAPLCPGAADDLGALWDLLEKAGVDSRCVVDFGTLRSFDYYTGMVLEAYSPGLGVPLGGGGRYDGLLSRFGNPSPAAGFALTLERVQVALSEQGVDVATPNVDAVVGGPDAADVFSVACELRAEGLRVQSVVESDEAAVAALAKRAGAVRAVWVGPDAEAGDES